MRLTRPLLVTLLLIPAVSRAADPTREEAVTALQRATEFFHARVASHGGYVWRYSGDLKLREGEAKVDPSTIWVQPPGTPTVGEAFLDAYEATGDVRHLDAAHDAAEALVRGQVHSGGWDYRIDFDPEQRRRYSYRVDLSDKAREKLDRREDGPGGWDLWKQGKQKGNRTVLDDDTTQSAVRFLARLDRILEFKDERVHEAARYALESLLGAQYPNGAWSHLYDRYPQAPPDAAHYPLLKASYPEEWSRTWTKDWTGCYRLNDRITLDVIETLLLAAEVYGDPRYTAAAERGGDFLLLAQMPEPQPAWVQQYDRAMRPVWDRKFEPPAISGLESQDALETLLLLYRRTGREKYLEPVPRALAYLRSSLLPDGRLARFYELTTNRPLYFTRDYQLTYDGSAVPKHYGFAFNSRLDAIEAEYDRLRMSVPADEPKPGSPKGLAKRVREVIDAMDERGAWIEKGGLDAHDVTPESGVIESRTFARNVELLSRYAAGHRS